MKRLLACAIAFALVSAAAAAADKAYVPKIDPKRLSEEVKTLSSDAFEGRGPAPAGLRAAGPRAVSAASISTTDAGWRAVLPLRVSRWGRPELALPSGTYRLELDGPAPGSVEIAPLARTVAA